MTKYLVCGRCSQPLIRRNGKLMCSCHSSDVPDATPTAASDPLPVEPPRNPTPPNRRGDVAVPRAPVEWTGDEPPLLLPEWAALGLSAISMAEASQHLLILGSSGAGKTMSAVRVLARAALRYGAVPGQRGGAGHRLRPSMLVIDPKRELTDALLRTCERENLERDIVTLKTDKNWTICLFEGIEPLDLTGSAVLEQILGVSASFSAQKHNTNEAFFYLQAEHALTQLFELDCQLYRMGGGSHVQSFWSALDAVLRQRAGAGIPTADMRFLRRHLALLSLATRGRLGFDALEQCARTASAYGVAEDTTAAIATLGNLPDDTLSSVVATAVGMSTDIASDRFLQHVDLDPFSIPATYLSIMDALNRGLVIVYVPGGTSAPETAVGRALKGRAFSLAYCRASMRRGFFYVCDEAARFISSHPASSEAQVLEIGRAYRMCLVLSTQSMSSLRAALATDPVGARADAALEIILTNTATKLFFRSTDLETRNRLRHLLPSAPVLGRPHLVDVRPPSTLRAEEGECYYVTSRGTSGRAKIDVSRSPV